MKPAPKPFSCPVCGEEVPPNAKACPECGACDKSGWSAGRDADGIDLPDEDFDYDKFLENEFGDGPKRNGIPFFWWVIALVLLFAFLAMSLHTFVRM